MDTQIFRQDQIFMMMMMNTSNSSNSNNNNNNNNYVNNNDCKTTASTAIQSNYGNSSNMMIDLNIDDLKKKIEKNSPVIFNFRGLQEKVICKYYELQQVKDQYSMMHNFQTGPHESNKEQKCTFALHEQLNNYTKFLKYLTDQFKQMFDPITSLLYTIINGELGNWHRKQQFAGNGGDIDFHYLDTIQLWFEQMIDIINQNVAQIMETIEIINNLSTTALKDYISTEITLMYKNLNNYRTKFNDLLICLIKKAFIIEKQPPQVMKTNTRFTCKIRFLIGSKLNVHLNPPKVTSGIISETQVSSFPTENVFKGEMCGDIANNICVMEYDQPVKQLSITFRNMQLKKIKRAEKRASESVVDEKFALYFSCTFNIGHVEITPHAISLPVTVIVHGNQEAHACATIFWDNSFSDINRKAFEVPEKVKWGRIKDALNIKFSSVTGKPLTPENMNYLYEKLTRLPISDEEIMSQTLISWHQFSKEPFPDKQFSFWDWFHASMKLTKEHLKELWKNGTILGFVAKKDAERLLSPCQLGTFLLRFSETVLGGITIACRADNGNSSIVILAPFTAKEFSIRGLADTVIDVQQILYLYPNIPKHQAFGHYCVHSDSQLMNNNGYIQPVLRTHVPGLSTMNTISNMCVIPPMNSDSQLSYPSTPQSSLFKPFSPTYVNDFECSTSNSGSNDQFMTMGDISNIDVTMSMNSFVGESSMSFPSPENFSIMDQNFKYS